jgi:WD40 repeat protein
MSELPVTRLQASVSGAGSFTYYNDSVVMVSEEGYIKFFDKQSGSDFCANLKLNKNYPVSKYTSEIDSNGKDTIVYSGRDNKVQMVFREKFDKPTKVAECPKPIHKIIYPNSKLFLICTESNELQIYWIEHEKLTTLEPAHKDSVLSADVDHG